MLSQSATPINEYVLKTNLIRKLEAALEEIRIGQGYKVFEGIQNGKCTVDITVNDEYAFITPHTDPRKPDFTIMPDGTRIAGDTTITVRPFSVEMDTVQTPPPEVTVTHTVEETEPETPSEEPEPETSEEEPVSDEPVTTKKKRRTYTS
jgi:hypothetical protein